LQRQADLLEVIAALGPARRLADLLHSRQKHRYEHGNDGNDHQQFNEREAAAMK
jgi:hypothetical protein